MNKCKELVNLEMKRNVLIWKINNTEQLIKLYESYLNGKSKPKYIDYTTLKNFRLVSKEFNDISYKKFIERSRVNYKCKKLINIADHVSIDLYRMKGKTLLKFSNVKSIIIKMRENPGLNYIRHKNSEFHHRYSEKEKRFIFYFVEFEFKEITVENLKEFCALSSNIRDYKLSFYIMFNNLFNNLLNKNRNYYTGYKYKMEDVKKFYDEFNEIVPKQEKFKSFDEYEKYFKQSPFSRHGDISIYYDDNDYNRYYLSSASSRDNNFRNIMIRRIKIDLRFDKYDYCSNLKYFEYYYFNKYYGPIEIYDFSEHINKINNIINKL